jgi:terminal uridylyltransferase
LLALKRNNIAWTLVNSHNQRAIDQGLQAFCTVTFHFYESIDLMNSALKAEVGFSPAPPLPRGRTNVAAVQLINDWVQGKLATLLPPPTYLLEREEAARRIQGVLTSSHLFSACKVRLFGSSRNGFGSEGSDLDMCLLLGDVSRLSAADQQLRIETMGQLLGDAGMEDVQVRSTARIPLVLFRDPRTGLDCDLSFQNPLAVSNTDLLLAYSCIDERVRCMAYIIKKWSKRRHLNSPGDGTLSSYGFILCLIHYLQNLDVPVLPNLQLLPSDWSGEVLLGKHAQQQFEYQLCVADNTPCNTYFLRPDERQFKMLQDSARLNKQSLAELLSGFFEYFAWKFDYRHDIVSIRFNRTVVHPLKGHAKLIKAEEDCWQLHERLRYSTTCVYCVGEMTCCPRG